MRSDIINNNVMEVLIFFTGAAGYSLTEYFFRGYTHWTMALTGGACLLTFYWYSKCTKNTPLPLKAAVGALIITAFEFFVGVVVNLWYGWDVWDYSGKTCNILGQVCPEYSIAWFLICLSVLIISEGVCAVYHVLQHNIDVRFHKKTRSCK